MTDEPITKEQLASLERVIDQVFGRLGIDIEFTRHFLDRVNDERNRKQITIQELGSLFAKEYKRWGNTIKHMPIDTQAVMRDLSNAINIPFVLNPSNTAKKELVAKTVMRKQDFKTPDRKLPVESVGETVSMYGAKKGRQVKGNEAMPIKQAPSKSGESKHPMRGRLVGEETVNEVSGGTIVKTVNGYPIHDMGANYPYSDKRFLVRDPYLDVWLSSAPNLADAIAFATGRKPARVAQAKTQAQTDHDDWRDQQAGRIASGEVRRAVMSRRGMGESDNVPYTSDAVSASWEQYRDLGEKILDPREAILRRALEYLDKKIQNKNRGKLTTLPTLAQEVTREVNLSNIATARDLVKLYRDWRGDQPIVEGWMNSDQYYLDGKVNKRTN